jgi:PGM1 C-terminal domain/ATP-grasp domain
VEGFDELQLRLSAALTANEAGSNIDHVVVALASYSVGETLLSHYVERLAALEHRYLLAQLMLNRIPGCEVLLVCSEAPTAEVVDYHAVLVGGDVARRMRARVTYVVVPDGSARSLAAKLLDRPDILADLRSRIGGRPALIEPWIVADDEVSVAVALGVPLNGTPPSLRRLAHKSEGRRVFALSGVETPIGCEDVCDVEDVLDAIDHILARRPSARAVVVKHDDSAAGDGNVILPVRNPQERRLTRDELRDAVAALPGWYLTDLAGGGVVEELIEGSLMSSPSVQLDIRPGGGVRVLSTHEQLVGGDNGQVFMGCRFPAHADYAPQLAQDGIAVAGELARRGVLGRIGIDFVTTRGQTGDWCTRALEINLRKGGTSHPYAALRNLVAGHYDADRGEWVSDRDGSARAYRSTDNVMDPAWTGRQPSSVIEAIHTAGLQFDPKAGTGIVLHMLSCLAVDGRFGATAIGLTPDHADELFEAMVDAVTG